MKAISKIFRSFRLLRELFHASPARLWLEGFSVLVSVFEAVVIRVIAVKFILDAVVAAEFNKAAAIIGMACLGQLMTRGFDSWMENCYRKRDNIRIRQYFHNNLYRCAVDVDLCCYDNPEYFDRFILTAQNSDKMTVQCVQTVNAFLSTVLTALLSGGLILSALGELLWIVLFCSLLHIFLNGKRALVRGEMNVAQSPYEKKQEYMKRNFFMKRTALDMRTTQLPRRFFDMFESCQEESLKTFRPYVVRQVALDFFGSAAFYGQIVAELALLSWRAMAGDISVGDVSMLLGCAQMLMGNLRFIGEIMGNLAEQGIFAQKYEDFLNLAQKARENCRLALPSGTVCQEPKASGIVRPVAVDCRFVSQGLSDFDELQVDDISFGYDEKVQVFSGMTLDIHKGQKIALVGPNGAGKSTLVNLILNFYQPCQGVVRYNRKDVREFDPFQYRSRYSLIFQNCQLYPFSIAENLLLRPADTAEDEKRVWNALEWVGLAEKIRKLPMGLHTPVTKEFDNNGVVFSGGESQRVVLARAFLQDVPFFIMDEPTSALDCKQELTFNQLLTGELQEKTLILISHRLSAISGVDYIYLINNGMVEEAGTHEELMEKQGHYARIYKTQSDLYCM